MKVFIVEDLAVMRAHLEAMLHEIPGISVVGHAVDELGAIECIATLLPDVVILDLSLQTGSGINVLENTKKHHSAIKVMVLTNHADEFYINYCMDASADYFFDKTFQFMEVDKELRQLAFTRRVNGYFGALQQFGEQHVTE